MIGAQISRRTAFLSALVVMVLAASASFRPGPVRLGIVMDNSVSPAERANCLQAVEALLATARPGDSVCLVTRGRIPFRGVDAAPGTSVRFFHIDGPDLDTAVHQAALNLADNGAVANPVILTVLAGQDAPPLGAICFRDLPPGTHIRLVGARARSSLAGFAPLYPWRYDLRSASVDRCSAASAELQQEIHALRGYTSSPATWAILSGSLLAWLGIFMRHCWLRRRKLHVLLQTTSDLHAFPLREGQCVTVSGSTLRRLDGRICVDDELSAPTRWLTPGDDMEITDAEGNDNVRVYIV